MKKILSYFSLLFVAAFVGHQSKASAANNHVSSRINNVRKTIKKKANDNSLEKIKTVDFTGKMLAQWGNWGNWGNWNNWNNWGNWRNWLNY